MKLKSEFYRLPLKFDAARLLKEIEQIPEEEWCPHPQGFKDNDALLLISVNGDPRDDSLKGPMLPTPHLQKCPYLQQVLASFQAIFGRTRLMRIGGRSKVQKHMDANYYWHQRARVHVPIKTTKKVKFHCGKHSVHMAEGESWIFDTWEQHMVENPDDFTRIHLVADTVGSARFWDLVNLAGKPHLNIRAKQASKLIEYQPELKINVATETVNVPLVMSPWEQDSVIQPIIEDMKKAYPAPQKDINAILELTSRFKQRWKALWSRFGEKQQGFAAYEEARKQFLLSLKPHLGKVQLPNGMDPISLIRQGMVEPSLNPELMKMTKNSPQVIVPRINQPPLPAKKPGFDRPIIIVAAPRSGSTLLFETLSKSPSVFTIGGESHYIIERIDKLNPENRNFESNQLTAEDADSKTIQELRASFFAQLHDRNGNTAKAKSHPVRMLEKTPKNALRIPFLNAVFPKAQFVYLYRNPRENISSIMDAWRSNRFNTYPNLPGWKNKLKWSLLLTPEWQKHSGAPVENIAADQWVKAHSMMLDALETIPKERICAVNYEEFIKNPKLEIEKICQFAGIDWDQNLENGLALSKHTLTKPDPNKWKKNEKELNKVLACTKKTYERIKDFDKELSQQVKIRPKNLPPTVQQKVDLNAPLASVHTANIPDILNKYAFSILATTYQAGRLIVARPEDGRLNTHFHNFNKPMGMTVQNGRLAIGTKNEIRFYRNMPNVAMKLEPKGKFDGCFLPRNSHVTGDIDIHEMNWVGNKLWFINTRFSCLCTLDDENSFIPQWRPNFISALAPEDRCHLNGLCLVDGIPKYVTALGTSDTPQGWRENKADGGVIIDIESGNIICEGLSMPHSPRWYQGKLWVLESGNGSLATVDIKTGELETIALLPGFTRGIDFAGDYAFIGLSQVRESAIFSGIPIAERLEERVCGIWVVDIKTGMNAGFIKFEGAVEEIFSVSLLGGMRFPEILEANNKLVSQSYVLPTEALKDVPKSIQSI
jgi:uncharacterized protein (TIGR03032 family)